MLKKGKYQHYKGQEYEVIGIAHHTETKSPMVLYKALYDIPELSEMYGDPVIFTRPLHMFNETVSVNDKEMPRFKYCED
tara:strand:- start:625 stop:861 length:237 start_codon:yes stop_codon:yes gene_type:complete